MNFRSSTKTSLMSSFLSAAWRSAIAVAILAAASRGAAAATIRYEAGTITLPQTGADPLADDFSTVTFSASHFNTTPLVFLVPSNEATTGDPAHVRIKNSSTTGFDLVQVEPNNADGPHDAMTVHWFAIEPGVATLSPGVTIEAKSVTDFDTVTSKNNVNTRTIDFDPLFSTAETPVVLAEIQTTNSEVNNIPTQVSSPWLTAGMNDVTNTSADVFMEQAEDNGGTIVDETMALLIISTDMTDAGGVTYSTGTFLDDGANPITFEAQLSPDSITGWDDTSGAGIAVELHADFDDPLVIANVATRDGGDGGWLRRGAFTDGTPDTVSLIVDEDTADDPERAHTDERANLLVFSSQSFKGELTEVVPEPGTFAIALIGLVGLCLGIRRVRVLG